MAKMTILAMVNKVINNLGDVQVTTLANMSGLTLQIFYCFNEALYEISQEYRFQPWEQSGLIQLSSGVNTYAKSSFVVNGASMCWYDKDSFRITQLQKMTYISPMKFDRDYISQTDTNNIPSVFTDWKGYFQTYPTPSLGNGSDTNTVNFRYWTNPVIFQSATNSSSDTATCEIPEGFDQTLLCDWVTYKILHYRHNPEAEIYRGKVWGDPQSGIQGSYSRFKTLYASDRVEDGSIMSEPLGGSGDLSMFVQQPITTGGT